MTNCERIGLAGKNVMETKTYDRQTAKFIAVLIESMPKIPSNVMQGWIQNPKGFQRVLAEALLPPQKFEVWRTVRIGGFQNAEVIRKEIRNAGMKIGNYADDILGKIPLATSEAVMSI